jgi:hypothetical protein
MKLSSNTVSVLKNFAAINQGLLFKQGQTLKTISSHKNILAEVNISETIPTDFGVFDLNNFISVVSMYKDDPTFEFDDKHVLIVGNKGRSKVKYRFCDPSHINIPPEKQLSLPNPEISFSLSAEDLEWVMRSSSVLDAPCIAIDSDGQTISILSYDAKNDGSHTDSLSIGTGNGDKYRMIFMKDNLSRVMPGAYDVKISSRGISHFKNKNIPLQYWITTESGSKFEKA